LKVLKYSVAAICLAISLASVFFFDWIVKQFLFLSPDRAIVPLMRLLFQLALFSLGSVGLMLILKQLAVRLLARFDVFIIRFPVRTFLMCALGMAAVLRLVTVVFMPFNQFFDYKGYDEYGWEWAVKGGYYRGEHPTAFWPPAYPFLLSRIYVLFGHTPELAAYLNVLLGTSIPLLGYLIVRKIWNESLARWTAVILVLFPSQILFTHLLASEFLFTPLLLLSIWLFLSFDRRLTGRWYKIIVGGILLGLASLTRAVSKLLLILIIPFWWWESKHLERSFRYGLLAFLGFSMAVVPWMIRNHYTVGSASINTNVGINLYIGNQPMSGMGYQQYLADDFEAQNPLLEAYTDSLSWQLAVDYIYDNPGLFLYRCVLKTGYTYATDLDPLWFGLMEAGERSETNYAVFLGAVTQSYWTVVLLGALLGLIVFFRSDSTIRNPGGYLLIGIVVYFTGIYSVFHGLGRYHFPLVPIISAFAALYIKSLVDKYRATC
jgi:4-amino-4-deoxy-L-arabinose transferase-like glycosyltransferase